MYAGLLDMNHPLVWTVNDILTPDECEAMIARIEAGSPELASINAVGGPTIDEKTRNNTRVIFDDPGYAELLWQRVREHVPAALMGMHPIGANERLRCYKYEPGQRFAPHYDGCFERNPRERSLLTFMVYLNSGFEGGETAFLQLDRTIVPATGMALLFQHPVLHEGCAVRTGTKYAVRTDIMFRET